MRRGLVGVKRSLEDVKMIVAGPAATLTARVTERMDGAGEMASTVSLVSNIWEQRNDGSWQLVDVQIASPSSISRTLR
jgi:ketosteroid isomerase-like protein